MYFKADKNLDYAKILDAMDIAMKNGVRVVGMISDQKPGTVSTVAGRLRSSRRRHRQREERNNGNGSRWRRRAVQRHQRHADDRRAAGAADHLHGGAAVHAKGDRHPAARSESDGRSRRTRRRTRSCSRSSRADSSSSTAKRRRAIISRARLKEIYDPRPEKIIFVKGSPGVKYGDVIFAMDVSRGAGVKVIGIPPKDTPGARRQVAAALAGLARTDFSITPRVAFDSRGDRSAIGTLLGLVRRITLS